jgi:hypothetical protein
MIYALVWTDGIGGIIGTAYEINAFVLSQGYCGV